MIQSFVRININRNISIPTTRSSIAQQSSRLLPNHANRRNEVMLSSSRFKRSFITSSPRTDEEKAHAPLSKEEDKTSPQTSNITSEEEVEAVIGKNDDINTNQTNQKMNPKNHQFIWRADDTTTNNSTFIKPCVWSNDEEDRNNRDKQGFSSLSEKSDFSTALERIMEQERQGGRMLQRNLGVLREDPVDDIRLLMHNYTVPALASALRDREEVLQLCATLLAENKLDELSNTLKPFEKQYVQMRRLRKNNIDLSRGGFDTPSLEMLRKALMRMPRRVSQAHQRRAGVVLPLCNVNGVPCILFEKRSKNMRAHADEVCLPGGMVCETNDQSIVSTCLREMEEEIPSIQRQNVTVLGILRCNWGEVAKLTGIAVTPVVGYVGDFDQHLDLQMNSSEVSECFVVPLECIMKKDYWIHKEDSAPIFTGGPYIIWGLTGYILDRFVRDVLARYTILF